MLRQNIFFVAGKSIFIDIIGDALFFPLWWYTSGLKHVIENFVRSIIEMSDHLALRLLILNIFKPMFAQTDRAGRMISFFMRIVILIGRSIYFLIYTILRLLIVLVWIAIPAFVFYRLVTIYWYSYVAG